MISPTYANSDPQSNKYAADARKLAEKIEKRGGAGLVGVTTNLVDQVWGDSRPSRPKEKIRTLPLDFTGKKLEEKIEDLRKELEKKKSAGLIVCMCSGSIQVGLRILTN